MGDVVRATVGLGGSDAGISARGAVVIRRQHGRAYAAKIASEPRKTMGTCVAEPVTG